MREPNRRCQRLEATEHRMSGTRPIKSDDVRSVLCTPHERWSLFVQSVEIFYTLHIMAVSIIAVAGQIIADGAQKDEEQRIRLVEFSRTRIDNVYHSIQAGYRRP